MGAIARRSLLLAPLLAAGVALGAPAQAQEENFPAREIRVICAFPPGSGADIWVRFFAEQARHLAGRPLIVENKPGANGNIATEFTARSKPDGYTIFIQSPTSIAANKFIFKGTPIDIEKSIETVATLLKFSFYMTVDARRPWKNVQDVVAHARERGAKASFATTSPPGRLMGNLFKQIMNLEAVEVPYRTAPDSINDILSGAVDFSFNDGVFAMSQMREGRLRVLGVGSMERITTTPDIPTMNEQGVTGLNVPGFFGVMMPAGAPRPVVAKINKWFVDVVNSKEGQEFIAKFGGEPLALSPEASQKMFMDSISEWGRLVDLAKIKPEG
ncbi:MAG: Extra-cytoplasmic solute receptor [Hyphomicrobiales bacterium]|nr:Extra-cytoplasmic solute receptor [Hyphomicrobiales bacterium]